MQATLEYLHEELKIKIRTTCHHLRNKAYAIDSELYQNAILNLIFYELLSDELWLLLGHRNEVIIALERYLAGEEFDLFPDPELNQKETIYQYCQAFFEQVACPLGSSTDELNKWVSAHADRQQTMRKGFDKYFPNVDFLMSEATEPIGEQLRPVTDADLFNSKTEMFLRDIEDSNALNDFNQRMQRVHDLLKIEADVADVLTVIIGEEEPQ